MNRTKKILDKDVDFYRMPQEVHPTKEGKTLIMHHTKKIKKFRNKIGQIKRKTSQ